MTCIVAIRDTDRVWMGADSAGSSEHRLRTYANAKVFQRGDWIIGYTTSFRMGQLLQYKLQLPRPPEDPLEIEGYMVTDFIDAVRHTFKKGGMSTKRNEAEMGGSFLVGYQEQLFQVQDNYQVMVPNQDFDAAGTGQDVALGSLYTTAGRVKGPRQRLTIALEAAQQFCRGVRAPFTVIHNAS